MIELLCPEGFADYELLDCGDGEKLERFGKQVLRRPEPQAVWPRVFSEAEWRGKADILFSSKSATAGEWKKLKAGAVTNWQIKWPYNKAAITLNLALTGFKHVGVFPEQAVNWKYITDCLGAMNVARPKVLNLFAYTGGASLAACAAGAEVTHVDSIKQVVSWARQNMEDSNLADVRWVVEDALKFVKREVRRGNTYNGIILDPPAYGHGPNGEKWKLEDNIAEMVAEVTQLLDKQNHFMILNTYSLGFSSVIVENLMAGSAPRKKIQTGELYLPATSGVKLPLGVFGRMCETTMY